MRLRPLLVMRIEMAWNISESFRNYHAMLQGFLRKRGASHDLAADITQETFLRILTVQPDAKPSNESAYLTRIARNISIDWYRRQRILDIIPNGEPFLSHIADEIPSAERAVISRQELRIMQSALDELPPEIRRIFFARQEGLTFAEIGARYGLSQHTVFSQMTRILVFLRHRLEAGR
ncbi:RNA polymerase sigma factor [Brucellaceae bacterium C25G]